MVLFVSLLKKDLVCSNGLDLVQLCVDMQHPSLYLSEMDGWTDMFLEIPFPLIA